MTYLCLEFDVVVRNENGMCMLSHRGLGAHIEHSGDWVLLLMELLRNPVSERELHAVLGENYRCSAKVLLTHLEDRGFIFRFSAEDGNVARYIFHNKRPLWEKFEQLDGGKREDRLLKPPNVEKISLSSALENRYSCSMATSTELTPENISVLLTMTYGFFKSKDGIQRRAVPAAGGLFPLDIYLSLPCGEGLENFLYNPVESLLRRVSICRGSIRGLCNGQEITDPAKGLVTYVYKIAQNTPKYGPRGLQFALIECGHSAQNLVLGAAGLGIGSRCIGAVDFQAAEVAFSLDTGQVPLYAVALY